MKENRYVFINTSFFKKIAHDVIFALTSVSSREFHENTLETNNPQILLFNLQKNKKKVTATSLWHICPVQLQIMEQDTPVRREPHQQLQSALRINNPPFFGSVRHKVSQCRCIVVCESHSYIRGTGHVCSTTAASTDAASFAVA